MEQTIAGSASTMGPTTGTGCVMSATPVTTGHRRFCSSLSGELPNAVASGPVGSAATGIGAMAGTAAATGAAAGTGAAAERPGSETIAAARAKAATRELILRMVRLQVGCMSTIGKRLELPERALA